MKSILLFIFILYSLSPFTQTVEIDSLKKNLETYKEDTAKVNTMNALAAALKYLNSDTAIYFAETAFTLATKLNYEPGIAESKLRAGNAYPGLGRYTEGIAAGNNALSLYNKFLLSSPAADKKTILRKIANSYNVLMLNMFPQGNYPEALKFSFLELKAWEQTGDKNGMSNAEFNIANIYYCQHHYTESLKHYFTSLNLTRQLNIKTDISSTYSAIGLVYFDQGNYKEAKKYYSIALKLGKEANDSFNLAEIYVNYGLLKYIEGNYNEALQYEFDALKIYEQTQNKFNIPFALNNIAMVYIKQKKYNNVSASLNKALSVAKETHHLEYIKLSYENFATLDSLQGNFKKALQDYRLAITYRDSMMNAETTQKITQQQMQYEFDKIQDSIKASQDKKNALAVAELKNQKLIRNFSLAGIFLVVSLGGYSFYRYRRRRRLQSEQEMLNERLRISRELHDDMGSTLGSISIYSEVAKNRSVKNENADEVILKIGAASRELIDKMSDIVWSINPNNESIEQLQNRMQTFAAMVLTPHNIQYNFLADEAIKKIKLTAEGRKNIFLIFKEAIHNIVKYADCKKVEIRLSQQNDHLEMMIKDEGTGFDVSKLTDTDSLGGNGIKNMKARAGSIKAIININSEINKGTIIELSVNLN